jgi:hypothetical protein
MATIDLIRRVATLGMVVAVGVRFEACARAQVASTPRVGSAPVVPGVGIAPTVPRTGIAPVAPSPPAGYSTPAYTLPPGFGVGGFGAGGFGVGGFGVGGFGVGGFGYPGMYGGFGGPTGGLGMSLPPTPDFSNGTYRAGNQFADRPAGASMGNGVPADPNAPPAGKVGSKAIGVPSEDPFDAAAAGKQSPSRETQSKRARSGRRPTVRKPAPQPSRKPEARASEAKPSRSEVKRMRDKQPATLQEKPAAAAKAEGAKPTARPRSMLGSP